MSFNLFVLIVFTACGGWIGLGKSEGSTLEKFKSIWNKSIKHFFKGLISINLLAIFIKIIYPKSNEVLQIIATTTRGALEEILNICAKIFTATLH